MPYITVPQSPIYHQITLDELLSGNIKAGLVRSNETNTRTFYTEKPVDKYLDDEYIANAINTLSCFVSLNKELIDADKHEHYKTFKIPKHSGGLRTINAPLPQLYDAQVQLRTIFENNFNALYHTCAFAYIQQRSIIDLLKRHQANNSRWFLKVDFHDFFGSTTKEFALETLKQIAPFSEVCKYKTGLDALDKALDLCFLDGGLPQGTPISPMLTNLLMIPIDFRLSSKLRDQHFIYTRYADDMTISHFDSFKFDNITKLIRDTLSELNAPYTFNDKKTRYGSRAGSNWNLGLMLNKDNNITIGHKKKKMFRAMLCNYVLDHKNNIAWSLDDVYTLNGKMSYYKMVEPEYIANLIELCNKKFDTNILALIKSDLNVGGLRGIIKESLAQPSSELASTYNYNLDDVLNELCPF